MRAQGARRDSVALSIAVDHIGGERPLIDRSSPKLTDGSRPHSRRWACSPKSQVAIGETIAIEVRQVQSGVDQDVANFEAALKDAHPRQRPSRRQGRFHAYVEELGKADPQPGRRPPWRVAAGFEAPVPQSPPWLVQQHQLRSAWRAGLPPFPSKLGELALAVVLRAQGMHGGDCLHASFTASPPARAVLCHRSEPPIEERKTRPESRGFQETVGGRDRDWTCVPTMSRRTRASATSLTTPCQPWPSASQRRRVWASSSSDLRAARSKRTDVTVASACSCPSSEPVNAWR